MKKIIVGLMCILIVSGFNMQAQEKDIDNIIKMNQEAPDFEVKTIDGKTIKLSDLKGKVVLVNFWATWCPPCKQEMPFLEKNVWEKYKSEDFYLLALAREEDKDKIMEFNKTTKYSFPMAPDIERKIYSLYAKKFIPRNYVVDKKGKIVFMSKGFAKGEFDDMVELIGEELKK